MELVWITALELLLLLHLILIELHRVLLVVVHVWVLLLLLLSGWLLDSSLPIETIGRLRQHIIWLVHTNLAFVKLDEWIQLHFALSEGHAFLEADAERSAILVVLDGANFYIYKATNNIAFSNIVLWLHILEWTATVLYHAAREGLAIEKIQHPIFLLLVLNNRVLIEIKIVFGNTNAHFDAVRAQGCQLSRRLPELARLR